jgi:hypothetical protein
LASFSLSGDLLVVFDKLLVETLCDFFLSARVELAVSTGGRKRGGGGRRRMRGEGECEGDWLRMPTAY